MLRSLQRVRSAGPQQWLADGACFTLALFLFLSTAADAGRKIRRHIHRMRLCDGISIPSKRCVLTYELRLEARLWATIGGGLPADVMALERDPFPHEVSGEPIDNLSFRRSAKFIAGMTIM